MLIARSYRISGRVQGVGFRYFVQRAARAEGVGGWVRNQDDGSVEAMVEGDHEAVLRLEHALRVGPPGARVDDIEIREEAPDGRSPMFTVRG